MQQITPEQRMILLQRRIIRQFVGAAKKRNATELLADMKAVIASVEPDDQGVLRIGESSFRIPADSLTRQALGLIPPVNHDWRKAAA